MTAEFHHGTEFDRQVRTLLDKGYPELTGLAEKAFLELVSPLRDVAVARGATMDPPTAARVPFVLVITKEIAPPDRTMTLTRLNGKPGFADYDADDLKRFDPIKELEVPDRLAYLVFDIDRGAETLNVTPDAAMVTITAQGRTPLTVDEGIAFVTHYPDSLAKNNCFSLVGSRCGDRRVPAIWISKKAPKLGWCWAGNPHTWLGSASCADRAGAS
jgi:hypothetical protein